MFNFSNQVVVVTGGSGNLGGVVVGAFQAAGAKLVIPDRSSDKLAKLFPTLAGSSDHYLANGIDVTNADSVQKLVDETVKRFGRIDVLVNTVGGYRAGTPLHETTLETWDQMLNLNARSIFIVCHAILPVMLKQQSGKILNVSSPSANMGGATASAYGASKSAVARITESMAAEYKRSGINVNAVLPGTLDTPQNREAMPNADTSLWVPLEGLADVILFLTSEAARMIQGALIPVTGKG